MATLDKNQQWKLISSHLEKMLNERYPKYRFALNELAITSSSGIRQIYVYISGLRWFSLTVTDEFIHDTPDYIDVLFKECCRLAETHIEIIEGPELILGSLELDN